MPAYRTDDLTTGYDEVAGRVAAWCLANPWQWRMLTVRSGRGDRPDSGGLTRHERAVQRALYRAVNSTALVAGPLGGRAAQNPDWSLTRSWGRPAYPGRLGFLRVGERRRSLWVSVVPKRFGAEAARRRPGSMWTRHIALQSGGVGSVKRRFP